MAVTVGAAVVGAGLGITPGPPEASYEYEPWPPEASYEYEP